MLQPMIMAAGAAEIAGDGGPASGVVVSVIHVGAAGGERAADQDAAAVPDLEIAA
jgi:hypothetical protein